LKNSAPLSLTRLKISEKASIVSRRYVLGDAQQRLPDALQTNLPREPPEQIIETLGHGCFSDCTPQLYPGDKNMKRISIFLYGVASYAACLVTFAYLAGFLGNIGVPKSIDSPARGPWLTALLTDIGLLLLFAVPHSVMARPGFKRMLTRVVPVAAERSTYVL